ncbi:integrase [Frankia sp. Hr75.2]|nr:integrase [Frankia sp. Hr75.2]
MKPYKACSCRDPETRRLLGKKCPDLAKKGHGKYYARYEAPAGTDGKRRQPRIGPFDTSAECKTELAKVLGQAARADYSDDRKIKVAEYLDRRYSWRDAESRTGEGLKRSTLDAEREALTLYLKPGLGHLKLVDLRDRHVRDLYAAMRVINRPDEDEADVDPEMLRRLVAARAVRDGKRVHSRPISESRIKRVHAVLTGAMNDAVKTSKILDANPAEHVFRTKGAKRRTRVRPLLWTDERVERWETDGHVPAKVMVWTSAQCGSFLDFSEACGERLHVLFHLDAYWGLRRGELVGLERTDLSVARRRLHVRQSQADDELDDTKTEHGDRTIVFDEGTATVLTAERKRQAAERLEWGEAYADSGRVFTYEDGSALKPTYVSQRFGQLVTRYAAIRARLAKGSTVERTARQYRVSPEAVRIAAAAPLPPIRFHDLRHGAATMLLASGAPMKLVSEVLGHASAAFTSDVYAVVAEELAEAAAVAIAAFVPRRERPGAVRAINVPSSAGS